jgi:hypothetical protein
MLDSEFSNQPRSLLRNGYQTDPPAPSIQSLVGESHRINRGPQPHSMKAYNGRCCDTDCLTAGLVVSSVLSARVFGQRFA